jgi:hypothetical protein
MFWMHDVPGDGVKGVGEKRRPRKTIKPTWMHRRRLLIPLAKRRNLTIMTNC